MYLYGCFDGVRSFIQEESELAIIKGIRRCGRHDSWCIVLFLNHDISKSNLGDSRHVFSKGVLHTLILPIGPTIMINEMQERGD